MLGGGTGIIPSAPTPFPNTYSLDFDGVDDYVDCGHVDALISATTFTISVWFKLDDAVGGYDVIVSQSQLAGRLNIYHQPGELGFQVMDSTICYFTIAFTSNDWTHVAMVFDGSQGGLIPAAPYYQPGLKCYLNGSKITTFTDGLGIVPAVSAALTNSLLIGKYEIAAGYELGGNVDELSIWSTALTDADISTLWNSGTPNNLNTALATTPVAWWRMGDFSTFFNSNLEIPEYTKIDNWSSHSMTFDGVNDSVNCGNNFSFTDVMTVSCWVKVNTWVSYDAFVVQENATGSFYLREHTATTPGSVNFAIYQSDATWKSIVGTGVAPVSDWFHFVGVADGSFVRMYVNGVSVGTPVAYDGTIRTSTDDLVIGDTAAGGRAANCNIDSVSIFDAALDASTITSIYNSGEPTDLSAFSKMSFAFDGVDDYISMGNPTELQITGNLTLSAWIKHPSAISGNNFIVGRDDGNTNRNYSMWSKTTGAAFAIFKSGVFTYVQDTVTSVDDGNWHHIMGVNDGTDLKLYIDGVLKATNAGGGGTIDNDTVNFTIGDYVVYTGNEFDGLIDDVAVFNSAKAIGDVWTGTGKPTDLSAESGLVGYWKFDDALYNGATTEFSVPDSSTNSNTGTSVNMDFVDLETDAPLSPVAYYRLGEDSYWNGTNWWTPDYSKNTLFSEKSFVLGGVDDGINCGNDTSLQITGDITVSGWFKLTSTNAGYICSKGYYGAGTISWAMYIIASGGGCGFDYYGGATVGTRIYNQYTSAVNDGNWHHLVGVKSGSTSILYLDGSVVGSPSGTQANIHNSSNDVTVGYSDNNANWFPGSLDCVSIWDVALDAATISSIFNSGKPNDLTLAASYTAGSGVDKSGDLQAYWLMGEGITNWNGTNWQLPDYSKNALFSQKSLNFDGVNDYIDCGNDSALQPANVTASAWINVSADGGGPGVPGIIGSSADNNGFVLVYVNSNNKIRMYIYDGAWKYAESNSAVTWGTWYHVAGTYDGSTAKLYVNGTLQTTEGSGSAISYGTSTTKIGRYAVSSPSYFSGLIDDVSIYNVAKSAVEVLAIYNSSVPKDESATSGLVGYWTFDDATFSGNFTIPDNSTNSNTGTSVNMDEVDLEFNSPTNPNAGLSSGMDEVDLEFNTPTNPSAGLSSGMAIDDKVNNAPDNINQGLSSGMGETAPSGRSTDVP